MAYFTNRDLIAVSKVMKSSLNQYLISNYSQLSEINFLDLHGTKFLTYYPFNL